MQQIKVVAFDCDGVMFDSEKANTAYYNSILAHFSMPEMTPEQVAFTHMNTVFESLALLFKGTDKLEAAHKFRENLGYMPFIQFMEIEPTLRSLLKQLRPDYITAIATNRTNTMPRVLEEHDLTGLFDMVVSAMDVDNPKPHPDQLLKIMDKFHVTAEEMLFIGDSEVDESAAAAAGVPFAAYQNPALLTSTLHIQKLSDILPFLNHSPDNL